jgi:hypothetical protein
MICRPLAVEEIEQSSQELPLKTSGGYWRSLFQGSFSDADVFSELGRANEINDTTRATAAR